MTLLDNMKANKLISDQAEKMLEFYRVIQKTNITTQKNQAELSAKFEEVLVELKSLRNAVDNLNTKLK